ncbi:hypothetical protein [Kineococcus radiotolerans]|uniref:hypothetical protein n=1 Tax=Kineococcus radiotolerans TaxID=131568 RepID=UPI00059C71CD|nr:hypothetical protein [Kineococcus radiotolerans]
MDRSDEPDRGGALPPGSLPPGALPRRGEPLPARWGELPWPRPTPAALVTVLARAVRPPGADDLPPSPARAGGAPGPWPARRVPGRPGTVRGASRPAPAVDPAELPEYARVRAATGVAALSEAELDDDEAFRAEVWLRAWVRAHRSPAVRAWLRARHPDLAPEAVTRAAREVSLPLALAVVDVEVVVVALREGWDDAWTAAVQEAGFGAQEARALHGREDAWAVVDTVLALTGAGAGRPGR